MRKGAQTASFAARSSTFSSRRLSFWTAGSLNEWSSFSPRMPSATCRRLTIRTETPRKCVPWLPTIWRGSGRACGSSPAAPPGRKSTLTDAPLHHQCPRHLGRWRHHQRHGQLPRPSLPHGADQHICRPIPVQACPSRREFQDRRAEGASRAGHAPLTGHDEHHRVIVSHKRHAGASQHIDEVADWTGRVADGGRTAPPCARAVLTAARS